jgi:hypothetical protein
MRTGFYVGCAVGFVGAPILSFVLSKYDETWSIRALLCGLYCGMFLLFEAIGKKEVK